MVSNKCLWISQIKFKLVGEDILCFNYCQQVVICIKDVAQYEIYDWMKKKLKRVDIHVGVGGVAFEKL